MADEPLTIGELGGYTNNTINREGLKKLVKKINEGASGVEYTAGDNITISDQNVISATDTKYTAGNGISISEQNVISALGGDWVNVGNQATDWAACVDSFITKYDLILQMRYGSNGDLGIFNYIPKGTNIRDVYFGKMFCDYSSRDEFIAISVKGEQIFGTSSVTSAIFKYYFKLNSDHYELCMGQESTTSVNRGTSVILYKRV